ncbi:mechanosensitive ion channel family protein [Geofilum rubicundum]|uniref:Small-conductance mechanosensitive channel n=1 Tax=Geofilum rubicundum JCM 15548 TaxID=1236989 RepID=A0A0E9M0J9_9BACT|nr:mechanosensitive ion channel family protein [Geofilum rubicundum]GAO30886.1 small-conductance mechanosensitive channel [Geofilum rubicundum JCM 15548]
MFDNLIKKSDDLRKWLTDLLETTILPEWTFALIDLGLRALILFILSFLVYYVAKKILLFYTIKLVRKTKSRYDDYLVHRRVFHRISHIAPAIVIYALDESFFGIYPSILKITHTLAIIYMIGIVFWTLQAALSVLEDIYNTKPYAIERPIRSYIQLLNLITIIVGALLIITYLTGVDVAKIFAGLGAMAAILLLIFKDTILGFVAGIQLSANKMMRVGDWISMLPITQMERF